MSGMVYNFLWVWSHLISFVYFSELVGNFDETSKGEWEECARIDKKSLVHVLLSVCDIKVTLECEAMRIFPSYNILETRP